MCKFITLDESKSFATRIISFDDEYVYCYTPPTYLIDEAMRNNGGLVNVRISSNNRDFSDADFQFRYDPIPNITAIYP